MRCIALNRCGLLCLSYVFAARYSLQVQQPSSIALVIGENYESFLICWMKVARFIFVVFNGGTLTLYIQSVVLSYFMMAFSALYVSYPRFPYFGSGAGYHAMNSTELLYCDTKV